MKTSEMIAMLERNPNLKFKRPRWGPYNSIGIKDGVLQMIQQNGDIWTYTPICNPNTDRYEEACHQIAAGGDDWQLVRTPVTWQEAIQAVLDKKKVTCECENCGGTRDKCTYNSNDTVCVYGIKSGTWYIGDHDHE